MKRILYILAIALSFLACTDEIDKSNRYTFTGETMADYLLNRSEEYSNFIKILEKAEMFGLLSTWGQYTLFLPTNEAVERYLAEQDSLYWATRDDNVPYETGITSPLLEDLSDSMAAVIAKTHLVEARYPMAEMSEGTLYRRNFNQRSLGISYKVVDEQFYIMINNNSAIIGGDNEVENGIVHIIGKAINHTSRDVPGQIEECGYFSLFSAALKETNFQDSLLLDRDEDYVPIDYNAMGFGASSPRLVVETKFFKYTAFIEPDEVFNANGIYTLDDLKTFAEKWYGTEEKGNYKSPKNALYKFVSYHFVPRELAYNDIIFHDIEYTTRYSGKFSSEKLMIPGFDRYDYFETMQGPLMKVTKPLSTAQGIDVFINYSKREIPFNPNMRHHVNVRIIPPTEFSNMKKEYADFNPTALNGILHPIDKILIYNEDEMVGNILNERMRFDMSTLIPELQCNKMRYYAPQNHFLYFLGENFSKNVKFHTSRPLLYRPGVDTYLGDFMGTDRGLDCSFKLPNVPPRTYEIRLANQLGFIQIYIDGKVTGIPIDGSTFETAEIGYVPDEETEDNGVENDKQMRNRGWMKAPDSFYGYLYNAYVPARKTKSFLRRILTTKYLDSGEHWLRIKCLSDLPFCLDYIEIVPLNIINDPLKPEDRH
ncbi:MAG: hypothetical protein E7092_04505 [Bacteroidales bacterium]|nr:hypothetical protein [Bacteroidales bacterium]